MTDMSGEMRPVDKDWPKPLIGLVELLDARMYRRYDNALRLADRITRDPRTPLYGGLWREAYNNLARAGTPINQERSLILLPKFGGGEKISGHPTFLRYQNNKADRASKLPHGWRIREEHKMRVNRVRYHTVIYISDLIKKLERELVSLILNNLMSGDYYIEGYLNGVLQEIKRADLYHVVIDIAAGRIEAASGRVCWEIVRVRPGHVEVEHDARRAPAEATRPRRSNDVALDVKPWLRKKGRPYLDTPRKDIYSEALTVFPHLNKDGRFPIGTLSRLVREVRNELDGKPTLRTVSINT